MRSNKGCAAYADYLVYNELVNIGYSDRELFYTRPNHQDSRDITSLSQSYLTRCISFCLLSTPHGIILPAFLLTCLSLSAKKAPAAQRSA